MKKIKPGVKGKVIQPGRRTVIMGILNITPDSFSDGGDYYNNAGRALERVKKMYEEGADIIDIGGESSRPGSEQVSEEEELSRVIPVIEAIRNEFGEKVFLSIDTYKAIVAREALLKGVDMINSLGGFVFDRDMASVAAEFGCQVVLYHINGEPKTMQRGEIYYGDVIGDISDFFMKQIAFGLRSGMRREQFILDPGIGFGKTVEQNVEIIRRLNEFAALELPLAIGVSRKSHLGELLKQDLQLAKLPETSQRLEAGLAETAIAVLNGAAIVRTHDVAQTKRFLSVLDLFK
jgi:dihydropteroate synthase